jgi:hypothetical protein
VLTLVSQLVAVLADLQLLLLSVVVVVLMVVGTWCAWGIDKLLLPWPLQAAMQG